MALGWRWWRRPGNGLDCGEIFFPFFTVFSLTLFSSASFFFCFSRCSSLSRWFCCCLAALMVLVAMERTPDDISCFLLLLPLLLARQALPFSSSNNAEWEEGDELRQDGGGVWQCWCSWRVTATAPPPGIAAAAGMEEMMMALGALVRLLVLLLLLLFSWCCCWVPAPSGVGVAAAGCGCSSSSLLRFAWFLSSGGVFVFPSLCFKASPFSPLLFFYLVSSLPILSQ